MHFVQSQQDLKSLLTSTWAQGKTVQQSFSAIRSAGVSVTYAQVVQFHKSMEDKFNQSFNTVFG
jgi:hypothetical protein